MQKELEKDIDFCRTQNRLYWTKYNKRKDRLDYMFLLNIATSMSSIWGAFLMVPHMVNPMHKLGLVTIGLMSTAATAISLLYLERTETENCLAYRDAAYKYGDLKEDFEILLINGIGESDQKYQACRQKREWLVKQSVQLEQNS